MRAALAAVLALGLLSLSARAEAPQTSPRPLARADSLATVSIPPVRPLGRPAPPDLPTTPAEDTLADAIRDSRARPEARPPSAQALREAELGEAMSFASPITSFRPSLRPDSIVQQALAKRQQRRKGAVCGNLDIQGREVGYVPGRFNACGVKDAVKIRAVSGVSLSQDSVMTCETAQALNKWVKKGLEPNFRRNPVVELKVAAHYACRTRNNRPGAPVSEHGKGRAIDISGVKLRDGTVLTILGDWKSSKALQNIHRAACGIFGTVLGPKADRYHQDHLHLDVLRHRGGPYCR